MTNTSWMARAGISCRGVGFQRCGANGTGASGRTGARRSLRAGGKSGVKACNEWGRGVVVDTRTQWLDSSVGVLSNRSATMHFPRSLRRPASVVGALSFFCTACVYPVRYVDDLAPGNHVVLALTDQGIPDMAPKLGQGVFLVGGVVQGIDQTNVTVAVQRTESTRGVQYGVHPEIVQWNGDVVPVPRADIAT